ncbi:MAG: Lrp/AsnC family transcriptional regulator [Burkholderiales bacterium]|nr:Lrp/AsnC family transcriptional regulator [Burkholderiales bacterium]
MDFELDSFDRKILALLQTDARLSYTEIGRRIHLSSPAVTERVRRLQDAGVIAGFGARLNLRGLGYSFEALVNITVKSHDALDRWAEAHPEVMALHATTGPQCALMRIAIRSPEHLKSLLGSLAEIGTTSSSMILSTEFEDRLRLPADQIPERL